jgi:hypothetical protein
MENCGISGVVIVGMLPVNDCKEPEISLVLTGNKLLGSRVFVTDGTVVICSLISSLNGLFIGNKLLGIAIISR